MTSARNLRDELNRLSGGDVARNRISIDSVLDRLYERLYDRPEEFGDLDSDTWQAFATQHYPNRELMRSTAAGKFAYRNVELGWAASNDDWRWPPKNYSDYTAMFAKGQPLHVLGECWGMSEITHPPIGGNVLLTGEYKNLLGPRVESGTSADQVSCLLGATWGEVHDFLDVTRIKNLANQPGYARLTVAGTIGTGGHGSSLHLGSLASMVEAITIGPIQPGGAPETFQRSGPNFELAVTHLGRLGPVVGIDLAVRNAYRIAETREILTLGKNGSWQNDLRALVHATVALQQASDVHSAELWIAPYLDGTELTLALGVRRYTNDPLSTATRPAVLRSKALQTLGHLAAIAVALLHPDWIRGILRSTVKKTKTSRVVMDSRDGLDFGAPNNNRMGAIEMGIDLVNVDRAVDALIATLGEIETIASTKDRYVFSPVGIRFVGQGEANGLSPQAQRTRTMHIEIPTFGEEQIFHGDDVLRPLQKLLANQFGGRPHWGQRVYLSTQELQNLWPPQTLAAMAALVQQRDPQGKFANPLLDPVLGI